MRLLERLLSHLKCTSFVLLAAVVFSGCGNDTTAPAGNRSALSNGNESRTRDTSPADRGRGHNVRISAADIARGNGHDQDAAEAKPIEKPEVDAPQEAGSDAVAVAAPILDEDFGPPGPESWASFRNGNAQLGIAHTTLPDELELLWEQELEYGIIATPAIAGGRAYVGALSGYLHCFDLRTGERLWKYRSIDSTDPDEFAAGFSGPPRVTDELVFAGDEDGVFHAVDRATGKRRWKFETGAEINGCGAILDDNIIVASFDSFLYCLKQGDGSVVWQFQTEDRINCSIAISGDSTFIAGCDEHLRVIDIRNGEQQGDVRLGSPLIASPAVAGDILYVGTHASEVVAVNWKTQKLVWIFRDPKREQPYHASAAVTDDYVLVGGHDKQMHCLNRQTGEREWFFATRAQINSSPAVVGERVFFGSNDGNMYGLNLNDGAEVWKYNVGEDIMAGPAIGEECLVFGSDGTDAHVYCFGKRE